MCWYSGSSEYFIFPMFVREVSLCILSYVFQDGSYYGFVFLSLYATSADLERLQFRQCLIFVYSSFGMYGYAACDHYTLRIMMGLAYSIMCYRC